MSSTSRYIFGTSFSLFRVLSRLWLIFSCSNIFWPFWGLFGAVKMSPCLTWAKLKKSLYSATTTATTNPHKVFLSKAVVRKKCYKLAIPFWPKVTNAQTTSVRVTTANKWPSFGYSKCDQMMELKLPNFPQNCPIFPKIAQQVVIHFFLQSNIIRNSPKITKIFVLLLRDNLLPRTCKNRPICSYWLAERFLSVYILQDLCNVLVHWICRFLFLKSWMNQTLVDPIIAMNIGRN